MIAVKTFVFNDFSENTYVLYDESADCIIIDPGTYTHEEKKTLDDFLMQEKLNIVHVLCTHCHLDHILGIAHLEDKYGKGASIHPAGAEFLRASVGYASVFGFDLERTVKPAAMISEGDKIFFGNSELEVVYTPGHADGSVCFVNRAEKLVFTGDVLFRDSIGRSDLPTGNQQMLLTNIREKLLTLPDDYVVYPGHGPTTTIGYEKVNNPYL
jgi:glyoxylase-like metal-dependent hydrolase (beta-lactamase superfamily II)